MTAPTIAAPIVPITVPGTSVTSLEEGLAMARLDPDVVFYESEVPARYLHLDLDRQAGGTPDSVAVVNPVSPMQITSWISPSDVRLPLTVSHGRYAHLDPEATSDPTVSVSIDATESQATLAETVEAVEAMPPVVATLAIPTQVSWVMPYAGGRHDPIPRGAQAFLGGWSMPTENGGIGTAANSRMRNMLRGTFTINANFSRPGTACSATVRRSQRATGPGSASVWLCWRPDGHEGHHVALSPRRSAIVAEWGIGATAVATVATAPVTAITGPALGGPTVSIPTLTIPTLHVNIGADYWLATGNESGINCEGGPLFTAWGNAAQGNGGCNNRSPAYGHAYGYDNRWSCNRDSGHTGYHAARDERHLLGEWGITVITPTIVVTPVAPTIATVIGDVLPAGVSDPEVLNPSRAGRDHIVLFPDIPIPADVVRTSTSWFRPAGVDFPYREAVGRTMPAQWDYCEATIPGYGNQGMGDTYYQRCRLERGHTDPTPRRGTHFAHHAAFGGNLLYGEWGFPETPATPVVPSALILAAGFDPETMLDARQVREVLERQAASHYGFSGRVRQLYSDVLSDLGVPETDEITIKDYAVTVTIQVPVHFQAQKAPDRSTVQESLPDLARVTEALGRLMARDKNGSPLTLGSLTAAISPVVERNAR